MANTRRVWFVVLPLAVLLGIGIALLMRSGGVRMGAGHARGKSATATQPSGVPGVDGASTEVSADPGKAAASVHLLTPREIEDPTSDVGGTEPVWSVRVPGLASGDVLYSLDVDGKWLADPKNTQRSPQYAAGRMYNYNGMPVYHSLLHWPMTAGQVPESVFTATPSSAEFRYVGRIRQAVYFRSDARDGMWGTDELVPRNAAARANLEAIAADPMLGHVRGVVLDSDRRPVAGARAMVTWSLPGGTNYVRSPSRTVVTAEDGTFEVTRLDVGQGSLIVRASGHPMSRPVPVRIGRADTPPVEVILAPGVIVSGTVTDGDGKPVPGANVMAAPGIGNSMRTYSSMPMPATTNALGLFSITSLAPGAYDFIAMAEGYANGEKRSVKLVLGDAAPTVDLVLSDGMSLRGRVVRKEGGADVGVPRVSVHVYAYPIAGAQYARQYNMTQRLVTTDGQGEFVVTGLKPNSNVNLSAFQGIVSGQRSESVVLTEGGQPPKVELRLPDVGRVTGRVVLPGGEPAVGAVVAPATLASSQGGYSSMNYYREMLGDRFPEVKTGADGSFTLEGLPRNGSVILEAKASGFAPTRTAQVSCDSSSPVTITLSQGGKVAGKVTEKGSDVPLAQMRVSLSIYDNYSGQSELASAVTDASGAYVIENVRADTYQIVAQGLATPPGGTERMYYAMPSDDVEVHDGATAAVDMSGSAGGTLRGKVVVQGTEEAVEGASVYANYQPRGRMASRGMPYRNVGIRGNTWTQADGAFEVTDLMPGFYNLGANKEGFYSPSTASGGQPNLTVRSGEATENAIVRLSQGGIVRGVVLDPDEKPVADAALVARRKSPAGGSASDFRTGMYDGDYYGGYSGSGDTVGNTVSGPDGHFEFVGLDPSRSPFAVATSSGAGPDKAWVGTSDDVKITSASLVGEVTLHLTVGGSIAGRVTDEQQQPVEGVNISVQRQQTGRGGYYNDGGTLVRTNAAGEYTYNGLTGGSYNVSINKTGYARASREGVTVTDGQPTAGIDLTLGKGRTLAGRVVDSSGKGLAGWNVSASPVSSGGAPTFSGSPQGPSDADGNFTIENAPTGTVRFGLNMYRQTRPNRSDYIYYTSGEVELPDGDVTDPVVLTLVSHALKGRVVLSGSKKPVAGALVMANVYSGGWTREQAEGTKCVAQNANVSAPEKTGEDGAFLIEIVPDGRVNFQIEGKGIARKDNSEPVELEGQGVVDAGDIEVDAALSITGRLLDASTHQPYQPTRSTDSINAQMTNDLGESQSDSQIAPDVDGLFTLENVKSSVTRLTVTATGYQPCEVRDLKMKTDGPTDVGDLSLEPGCTLAGILYDPVLGKPFTRNQYGISVQVREPDKTDQRSIQLQFTGDDGKFEVRGVPRLIESLRFSANDYAPTTVDNVPRPDANGVIDLGRIDLGSGGVILGTVVDTKDVACPNVQVRINMQQPPAATDDGPVRPGERRGRNFSSVQRYCSTNNDGKFRVGALPTGAYTVSAQAQGFAPSVMQDVAVTSGGAATVIKIVLDQGAKISGTLVDLNTHILNGWSVMAQPVASSDAYSGGGSSVSTNELGHFELSGVPQAQARLRFSYNKDSKSLKTSMSFRSAPFVPANGEAVYILPLGPEIKGRLVDDSGHGVAGARIQVSQSGSRNTGSAPDTTVAQPQDGCSVENLNLTVEAATDDSGRFKIGPVAVGPANITFYGDMIVSKSPEQITVAVEDEHDMGDVTVLAAGVLTGRFVDKVKGAPARLSANNSYLNVQVYRPNGGSIGAIGKIKSSDSTFRITGVPADATRVTVQVQNFCSCEIKELRIVAGQETDLGDVELDPGVVIRCHLVMAEGGAPYKGGSVYLSAPRGDATDGQSNRWNASANQTRDSGVYICRAVPSDLKQLTLTPNNCEPIVIESLPSPDGNGIVDLGDRKVTPKPTNTGTPARSLSTFE